MGMYISTYLKYVNGKDITRVAYNELTFPAQNCLLYKGKLYNRPGITNDGTPPTPGVLNGIIGEHVWKDQVAGNQIASRATGTKWEIKYNGQWLTIYSGFSASAVRVRWDTWLDTNGALYKKRMFGADGTQNVYEWNGAIAQIASVAGSALTIAGSKTLEQLGFDQASINYNATTIAFATSGSQITDSSNGFVTSGFRAGQKVVITGSVSNNGTYTIVGVQPGALTVLEALVNEGAGAADVLTVMVPITIFRFNAQKQLIGQENYYTQTDPSGAGVMTLTATPSPVPNAGDIIVASPFANTTILNGFLKDEVYTYKNQLGLASLSSQTVWFSNGLDAHDYVLVLSSPTTLSPYNIILDNFWTAMIVRQNVLWVSTADDWINYTHLDAADSTSGLFFTSTGFEQPERNGALPFAITSFAQDAIFVSQDHRVQQITTIAVTGKDAMLLLSDDIDFLLQNTDLTECRVYFQLRYIFIVCPKANTLLMLDTVGYPADGIGMFWQPPQILPIASFSVIDGTYCGHSNSQDETYFLFQGGSDLGADITVVMAFGYIGGEFRRRYINIQDRHQLYAHTRIGVDGRINPATKVTATQFFETDGAKNLQDSIIDGSKIKTFDLPADYTWTALPWTSAAWTGEPPSDTENTGDPTLKRFYVFDKNQVTSWFEHRMIFTLIGQNMNFHLLGFSMDVTRSERKVDSALWLTK